MVTGGFSHMRATDRDRESAAEMLKDHYVTGRLSREEYDVRLGQLLTASTYAQLDGATLDLAPRMQYPDRPVLPTRAKTNNLAVAAIVCAALQPVSGMITTIPAIVLGHLARGQIKRSGEAGKGMATWGLALGWAGLGIVVLFVLAIIVGVSAAVAHR
jgi:Domain of unknown function (DUF4190)/Domain of unknown function (DUF1707)